MNVVSQPDPLEVLETRSKDDVVNTSVYPDLTQDFKTRLLLSQRRILIQQNTIQAAQLNIANAKTELQKAEIEFGTLLNEITTFYKVDVMNTSLDLETQKLIPKVR